MKYKTKSTNLICLECGNVCTIHRSLGNLKKEGHIKDLWCYCCKKKTHHYEVKDIATFLLNCGYKGANETEQKVISLIRKKNL